MIGHKYGSAYLSTEIEKEGFEAIRDEIIENRNDDLYFKYEQNGDASFKIQNVLDHCYGFDTNVDPNIYRLKDLNEIIRNHLNERKSKLVDNKYMKDLWFELETKLIRLFQDAALVCCRKEKISEKFREQFFCSGEINFFILYRIFF